MFTRRIRTFGLRLLAPALAVLAALALPLAALAGGVVISLDENPPADLRAGDTLQVGFMVRSAHEGHFPITDATPVVRASNAGTGEEVRVNARAEGDPGHYVADLTLPSAGSWEWAISLWKDEYFAWEFSTLEVRPAGAAAAGGYLRAGTPWLVLFAVIALPALALLAARGRGRLR
jgi:hypothetical protein